MLPINFQNLPFHQTATGYVVNQTNTKMLLIFHKKLQKWLPAGGHINEGEMPHIAAQREVLEETGIVAEFSQIQILDQNSISLPNSFATFLQIIEDKNGKHLHLDFAFKMTADDTQELLQNKLETNGIGWFDFAQIQDLNVFPSVLNFGKNNLKN